MLNTLHQKLRLLAALLLFTLAGHSVWVMVVMERHGPGASRLAHRADGAHPEDSSREDIHKTYRLPAGGLQPHVLPTCLALVILLCAIRLLDSRIAKPLRDLRDLLKRVEGGDTLVRYHPGSQNEFDELGSAMNVLLDTTARYRRELSEAQRVLEDKAAKLAASEMALRECRASFDEAVRLRTVKLSRVVQSLEAEAESHGRIEERLRKEKLEADALNRAKSEFLANMSHELRTPLNTIMGFTDLLLDRSYGDLNAAQEEYLIDVSDSAHHLLAVINDILDLSKVEAGKLELELSEASVSTLLHHSLIVVKEKALRHRIRVKARATAEPDFVFLDEKKMKQILFNLLSNAVKFTPDGGEVTLTAEDSGPCVQFSVADTGMGIKPEDLQRIFHPFERVESSSMRHFQGTGLGLSLCRSFVQLHGGRIWAESEGEGHGATIRFVIPRKNAVQSPEAESQDSGMPR
ncbi:MAG: ATP-binding protein [Syntrophobacteraceae bacterium]|jgi:signal transduction histidine kinase|nr:ATP-binding protein [Syntrophobacteraceae bacterium]